MDISKSENKISIIENNLNIDIFVIYSLGIIGIILYVFFPNNDNQYSLIIGNSITIISLVILVFMILYRRKLKKNIRGEESSISEIINIKNITWSNILVDCLPIALLISGIVYYVGLNIAYDKNYNIPEYETYDGILKWIVVIQILLIYKYSWDIIIKNEKNQKNKIQSLFIILLGIINITLVIIMHIMAKNYTITDN